jgi:DNA-binding transcriptional ArsR family regulator
VYHAAAAGASDGRGGLTERVDITKNVVMKRNYLRAIPREWRNISRAFTALGDEHRQRILLTFEAGERLNVGQIVEVSTLSRSAVSHHLKILKAAQVLDSVKSGKEVYYWIDKRFLEESLEAVLGYIREHA